MFENTKYSNVNAENGGYWLESSLQKSSDHSWFVSAYRRQINIHTVSLDGDFGVRPAIEVLKKNIEF